MKMRVWLKNEDGSVKPISLQAPSKKKAMELMKKNYHNQEVHKIERWVRTCWKTYVR